MKPDRSHIAARLDDMDKKIKLLLSRTEKNPNCPADLVQFYKDAEALVQVGFLALLDNERHSEYTFEISDRNSPIKLMAAALERIGKQ